MFNTLKNDDEHLVHMCFCDEAPCILEDMFIKSKKYVSFSKGMPRGITHGDTAFVFNRSRLEDKGYEFTNIEYTREFLDKNPDLKEHVYGDDFNIEKIRKLHKNHIKELKKHKGDTYNERRFLQKQIKNYEGKDIVRSILNACEREKESVLCDTCIDFEVDDIDAIICSSRTVLKYYPLPTEFLSKITYIHDYFHVQIINASPLHQYMENLKLFFEKVKQDFPTLEDYIPMMYHLTYLLAFNVNARKMAIFEPKPVMELSSIFEKAFANLSKINEDDKQDYVDRLLFKRILYDDKKPHLENFFSDVFKKYCIS